MASLVADYGSDSDDVDENNDERNVAVTREEQRCAFFSGCISSSSSDEDDVQKDKTETPKPTERLPNPLAATTERNVLPCPVFSSNVNVKTSVFINPFKKAEEAKLSVLQQHVKLTDSEKVERENRKNICNSFKKGRCRFGSKCKYRHVIDVASTGKSEADGSTDSPKPETQHGYYGQHSYHSNVLPQEEVDDDNYIAQKKRKHRSGVKDNLIPPKKAMKGFEVQRAKERPWTMNT